MDATRHPPALITSLLAMLVLVFACLFILLLSVDQICSADIELWAPLYPGARVTSVEYTLLRPRAMGVTTIVLTTADEAETVRTFYRENTLRLLRQEQTHGLATTDWRVEPGPNGDGSIITLRSECGEF